jgi:hypothetical protein
MEDDGSLRHLHGLGHVYLFPRAHAGRRHWVAARNQLRRPLAGAFPIEPRRMVRPCLSSAITSQAVRPGRPHLEVVAGRDRAGGMSADVIATSAYCDLPAPWGAPTPRQGSALTTNLVSLEVTSADGRTQLDAAGHRAPNPEDYILMPLCIRSAKGHPPSSCARVLARRLQAPSGRCHMPTCALSWVGAVNCSAPLTTVSSCPGQVACRRRLL